YASRYATFRRGLVLLNFPYYRNIKVLPIVSWFLRSSCLTEAHYRCGSLTIYITYPREGRSFCSR
ncbi:hypothetical protein K443DRAFT_94769, partial [Laccaria amethystina LaAM-08-1]